MPELCEVCLLYFTLLLYRGNIPVVFVAKQFLPPT